MQKSIRIVVAFLSFTVAPALHASIPGTNPPPQTLNSVRVPVLQTVLYTLLNLYGL